MDRLNLLLATNRAGSQRLAGKQRARRGWQLWVALFCMLSITACGADALPTPTAIPPQVPPSTTVAPIATPTALAAPSPTAASQSALSVLPTATLSATIAAAPIVTITVESPLTVTTSTSPTATASTAITNALTFTTTAVTATAVLTTAVESDVSTTVTAVGDTSNCATDVDIALAAYPDLHAYLGCAQAPASFDPVAINEFGVGPAYDRFMLWFGSENQIYVLLPNKEWQRYADTWSEDQPTFACNPSAAEPTSPPLPRRGFGKIWCEVEGLQATMGMVEREERLCQHTVTQRFELGRLLACYEDATIRFFRIMDDGTWDQMLTQ